LKNSLRSIVPYLLPLIIQLGLYLLALAFINGNHADLPSITALTQYASYFIFAVTGFVSWRFNRSRVFYFVLILAISQFVITVPALTGTVSIKTILSILSAFLPLNFLIFAFSKEQSLFTAWGLAKTAFLALQIGAVSFLLNGSALLSLIDWLSRLSLIFFMVSLGLLLIRYLLYKSFLDAAFIGNLAALFTALSLKENMLAIPAFLAASGLMLLVALIQDMYSLAFMDELTGLPSRRALKHELMKLSGTYTIAMLDIDFFKKFNDTYGHDVGDQVLKMVAGRINNVSGGGKSFRYGGEEFTILFPGKNLGDVIRHLEELRETISKRGFSLRGKNRPKKKPKQIKTKTGGHNQVHITVSIGVAQKNDRLKYPDEVIQAADAALYRAKKKGRNCVSK